MHFLLGILGSLIFASVGYYLLESNESIELSTPFGRIKGYASSSRDSKKFWQFRGIPFAQPPVGSLRFKPPVSFKSWDGTLDAKSLPPPCAQYDNFLKRHSGQEDCLYLNIFTPKVPGPDDLNELRPVMVFVHGGSFLYGSSHLYGAEYFMDEDVVLVTIHYRLGILGFLNTGDDTIMGNMGLKDVLEGLKWIQKGIAAFGGDPSRVSIFGESAGAAMVHYLMLSNQTKGLFRSAISQSGTALFPWAFVRNPRKQAFRVGNKLGCPSSSSPRLLMCLQQLDTFHFSDFHRIEEEFWSEKFGPSIEAPTLAENKNNALILQSPVKIASDGNYEKVPWVLGVTSHEGCILSSLVMKNLDFINNDWKNVAPLLVIEDGDGGVTMEQALAAIRLKYFGKDKKSLSKSDLDSFTSLFSHKLFYQPLLNSADYHRRHSNGNLYLYYFSYPGRQVGTEFGIGHLVRARKLPFVPLEFSIGFEMFRIWLMDLLGLRVDNYGTCHADDLKYLFMQNPIMRIGPSSQNYQFSKDLVHSWTEFAKNGIPKENWLPAAGSNKKNYFYEISGPTSTMVDSSFESHNNMNFWRQLQLQRNLEPYLENEVPYLH